MGARAAPEDPLALAGLLERAGRLEQAGLLERAGPLERAELLEQAGLLERAGLPEQRAPAARIRAPLRVPLPSSTRPSTRHPTASYPGCVSRGVE
jgi:hypothetical protein